MSSCERFASNHFIQQLSKQKGGTAPEQSRLDESLAISNRLLDLLKSFSHRQVY